MMRYLFVPYLEEIPQWKQCYYDYDTLNQMIQFIEKSEKLYDRIKHNIIITLKAVKSKKKDYTVKDELQKLKMASVEVRNIMDNWNDYFYEYSEHQKTIILSFVQYKAFQMGDKFKFYQVIFDYVKISKQPASKEKILTLIENLYIEINYVERAISFNIAKVSTIENAYSKFTNKYSEFLVEFDVNNKLLRMKHLIQNFSRKLLTTYTIQSQADNKIAHQSLRKLGENSATVGMEKIRNIGMLLGVTFMLLIASLIFKDRENILLEQNLTFKQQFPVWRGASYIIFYIWILGLNVLFYEASQINYKLIFHFNTHYLPQSKFFFTMAGILSILYFALFFAFLGSISSNNDGLYFRFYGEIFWAVIICYLFLPFPIMQYKGRLYFLKLMGKVICSPCIKMNFLIIWMSQQLVSLNQPFADFFYTVCSFTSRDYEQCTKNVPIFSSTLIITMFSFRILQNLKFWFQISKANKKYNFQAPPFLGFIRAFFGLNTAIAALLLRQKAFKNAQTYWIFLAITTTLVSWIVDLKGDWGLLGFQHKFLRQKLLFPKAKILYYLFAVINLVLRAAWVLSISPFVVKSTGFMPLIFIMIISYIEIFRRGLWNTLRLQFEHIQNCRKYQATISDDHILKSLKQDLTLYFQEKRRKQQQKRQESLNKNEVQQSRQNIIEEMRDIKKDENIILAPKFLTVEETDEIKLSNERKLGQLEVFQEKLRKRIKLKGKMNKNFPQTQVELHNLEKRVQEIIQTLDILLKQ